jgi:hypothetical protein
MHWGTAHWSTSGRQDGTIATGVAPSIRRTSIPTGGWSITPSVLGLSRSTTLSTICRHGKRCCNGETQFRFSDLSSPKELTAEWTYVRFHGPDGAYHGSYSTESLSGWAGVFATWSAEGKEVYCYFNNDAQGHAPRDAARLQAMVED